MKGTLIAFLAGVMFAVGLVVSGMTNPEIVTGFLDIFGEWNYSLAFVMGGALLVNVIAFKVILSKPKPLCETQHYLPTNKLVDKKLVVGSILFGVGWGALGVCPGPGLVNLMTFEPTAVGFIVSMLVGMEIFNWTKKVWE